MVLARDAPSVFHMRGDLRTQDLRMVFEPGPGPGEEEEALEVSRKS